MTQPASKRLVTEESIHQLKLTAYEVALANGFVGTETEWLASLVGPTGALGITLVGSPSTPTTNAATARPATSGIVYWICAYGVNPVNAAAGDLIWNADL